jgi:hypothetical protein
MVAKDIFVSSDTATILEELRLLGQAIGALTCSWILTWSSVGQICPGIGNILMEILQLRLFGYGGDVSR